MSAPVSVRPGLAHDPALPHRDLLLDPDAARGRLAAAVGASGPPDAVAALRVRYQPGRALRVTQVLSGPGLDAVAPSPGAPVVVSTRGVRDDRFDRLVQTSGAAPAGARDGSPVVADPATSSVSWLFPHDRRLTTLPDVWHRTGSTHAAVGRRWASTELVALSPEKAATLRCRGADGEVLAYVKVHPTAEATREAAERLAAAGGVSRSAGAVAPTVLASSSEARTVVVGPVRGRPLSDLDPHALTGALTAMGATLARLHTCAPGHLPSLRRFAAPSLHAAAEAVVVTRPELAATAVGLAAALAASRPTGPEVLVHADAQLANGLLTEDGVVLVDFDEAAAGHPAVDVAGVLASLRRGVLLGTLAPERETPLARAFLDGYAAVAGEPDPHALRWHTAATLLVGGAARAVRRVQVPALLRLAVLLDHAADLAADRAPLPGAGAPDLRRRP